MNVNTRQNDTGVVKGEFKQCTLARTEENGVSSTTTYIPLKYARVGRTLELQQEDGEWNTWVVIYASDAITVDPVDPRVLIKSHRRATGDSMPRKK